MELSREIVLCIVVVVKDLLAVSAVIASWRHEALAMRQVSITAHTYDEQY
jgi:hypothetical protein